MKQHIAIEQLNEISDEHFRYLLEWGKSHNYSRFSLWPLLSIGQLIEFIDENTNWNFQMERRFETWVCGDHEGYDLGYEKEYEKDQLCDALWEAIKEVLEHVQT